MGLHAEDGAEEVREQQGSARAARPQYLRHHSGDRQSRPRAHVHV
jgi:hypothetical protein